MLGIMDMFKNYIIESKEDIPVEYIAEVEQRLSTNPQDLEFEAADMVAGEEGNILSDITSIEASFKDDSEFYFGHGTSGDKNVITSILQTGLKTVNPKEIRAYGNSLRGLDSTSIVFGSGMDNLFEDQKNLLDNWPHKDSQNVVIISIPKEYILRMTEIGTFADPYQPFYVGSEENGYSLRPEFIRGIYSSESQSFTENKNFYQNLDEDKKKILFKDVRKAYIKSYAEYSNVNPKETTNPLPLSEQELEEISIEWYKIQLRKLNEDKTFDEQCLNDNLQDMTEDMTWTDFNDATHSIKNDARDDREDEVSKDDEGWSKDDDWD